MPTCNLFETIITFGSNNLARGVLAFLLQRLTITCEHLGKHHFIMPFYKVVHLGLFKQE
jgi:hypothetical protein